MNARLELPAAAAPDDWAAWARHVNPPLARFLELTQRAQRFVRGQGQQLVDARGQVYTDWVAGFGALALGHRPRVALDALRSFALDDAPHLLVEAINPAAGALARALCHATGGDFDTVFFGNSGTEAVEAAVKACVAATRRDLVVYMQGAYHGTTLGALAMMAPGVYRDPFESVLCRWQAVPFDDVTALAALDWPRVAAMVVEPIQVESGVRAASSAFLRAARRLCTEHGAKLVFDEVQTGLGRTGAAFVYPSTGLVPDVLCLAKALGAGVVPIGATLMRAGLFDAAYGSPERAEAHHSTYGGNALACTVALAVLRELTSAARLAHVRLEGQRLQALADEHLSAHPLVARVRFHGLLGVVDLRDVAHPWFDWSSLGLAEWNGRPSSAPLLVHRLHRRHNLLLQPCGHAPNSLRIQPPLTVEGDASEVLIAALREELDWLAAHDDA